MSKDIILPPHSRAAPEAPVERVNLTMEDLLLGCDYPEERKFVQMLIDYKNAGNKVAVLHPNAVDMLDEITARTQKRMKEKLS